MRLFLPLFLLCSSVLPTALSLDQLVLGSFGQTATYAVAKQLGLFESYGLNVTFSQIPNSSYGYATLLSGGYDLVSGAMDNAVNLRFNDKKNLTILGQIDGAPGQALGARPNITSPLELRGKALMVDNATSGFAYVLRKILSLYGLWLEKGDYYFVVVGTQRLQKLEAGVLANGTAVYGTILSSPQPFQGEAASPPISILANVSDFINPYANIALTVFAPNLANSTKRDLYVRFIAAEMVANKFLSDAANANCSIQALITQVNLTTSIAEQEYTAVTTPGIGETSSNSTFAVNRQGLLNVIDIRSQFGGFTDETLDLADAIVPGPGKFIDDSVRLEAIALAEHAAVPCSC